MVVVDDGQEWKVVDGARYCTGLAWRNDHLRTNRPLGICASLAAHLVDVPQQVGRIFVDATRTGPLELVTAVATRQQPDAKAASALRSQHVPDTSPTTKVVSIPTRNQAAAAKKRSGSGLAYFT